MNQAAMIDSADYPNVGAALAAGFATPEGKYPAMDHECSIRSTKPGALNAVEGAADGAGIIPIVRESVTNLNFIVLRALYVYHDLEPVEKLSLVQLVRDEMKSDVSWKFVLYFTIPLWAGCEETKTIVQWSDALGVPLRTLERRSSDARKILGRLRGRAFDAADKALRLRGKL